jgi:4-hydroxybenzoate polyprenyltransferase
MTDHSARRDSASGHSSVNSPVADAIGESWVYRLLPETAIPYAQLARLDRPIGAWLLMFPGWWALALAGLSAGRALPNVWYLALIGVGAMVMRGAGCTYNDIVDRNYDGRVARTASRPIPSGRASVKQAAVFGAALSLIGLLVLLQFNHFTILLGMSSLLLVAIYPFMKRLTYWPQLVLGLTFNWGALVGWSAAQGNLSLPPFLLYAGCIAWTIGYDTIYAHQDKEDDLSLGLKSTALKFGERTIPWVGGFYVAAWILWAFAIWLAGGGVISIFTMSVVALMLFWQVTTLKIDDPENCLKRFRANRDIGIALFAGLTLDAMMQAV